MAGKHTDSSRSTFRCFATVPKGRPSCRSFAPEWAGIFSNRHFLSLFVNPIPAMPRHWRRKEANWGRPRRTNSIRRMSSGGVKTAVYSAQKRSI
jgi:hypothetical protein